jgi:hypothetical protein
MTIGKLLLWAPILIGVNLAILYIAVKLIRMAWGN